MFTTGRVNMTTIVKRVLDAAVTLARGTNRSIVVSEFIKSQIFLLFGHGRIGHEALNISLVG